MADFDPTQMDEAARQAEDQLSQMLADTKAEPTAQDLIDWHYQWYMHAGYKRLGRILVGIAKEKMEG